MTFFETSISRSLVLAAGAALFLSCGTNSDPSDSDTEGGQPARRGAASSTTFSQSSPDRICGIDVLATPEERPLDPCVMGASVLGRLEMRAGDGDRTEGFAAGGEGRVCIRTAPAEQCRSLNFDLDDRGRWVPPGTILDDQWADDGVEIECVAGRDSRPDTCLSFTTDEPTGGDVDLGTPNEAFDRQTGVTRDPATGRSGAGRGSGGESGEPGENATSLFNAAIIAENVRDDDGDGRIDEPDDSRHGGTFRLTFDAPRDVASVTLIDIDHDESGGTIRAIDSGGADTTHDIPTAGDNSVQTIPVAVDDVVELEIVLPSSGALAEVVYGPGCNSPPDPGAFQPSHATVVDGSPATSLEERRAVTAGRHEVKFVDRASGDPTRTSVLFTRDPDSPPSITLSPNGKLQASDLHAEPPSFTPDGDGSRDTTMLSATALPFVADDGFDYTIEFEFRIVRRSTCDTVDTLTGSVPVASPVTLQAEWDGTDAAGATVSEGEYALQLAALLIRSDGALIAELDTDGRLVVVAPSEPGDDGSLPYEHPLQGVPLVNGKVPAVDIHDSPTGKRLAIVERSEQALEGGPTTESSGVEELDVRPLKPAERQLLETEKLQIDGPLPSPPFAPTPKIGEVLAERLARGRRIREIDLANGDEDLRIFGPDALDLAQVPATGNRSRVTTGDLNDDGFDDVVVGATGGNGPDDNRPDSGEIHVLFGVSDPVSEVDLSGDTGDFVLYAPGKARGLELGASVATGDFDGDGVTDLATSDPRANAIVVMFGPLTPGTSVDLLSDSPDLSMVGGQAGDLVGWRLAAADLNGDGADDLVVEAPGADGPSDTRLDAGELFAIAGGPWTKTAGFRDLDTDPPEMRVLFPARDPGLSDDPGNSLGWPYQQREIPTALSVGDVDGDGIADLVVGVRDDGPGGMRASAGRVDVVAGRAALGSTVDLGAGGADVSVHGRTAEDAFGWTSVVADVSGDGTKDLVVAAPGATNFSGRVHVLPGPIAHGTHDVATDFPDDIAIDGPAPDALLGFSLAAADMNGDFAAEIAMGSCLGNLFGLGFSSNCGPSGGRPGAGRVDVVPGGLSLESHGLAVEPAAITIFGDDADDATGLSMYPGDVDGDETADFVLGAPGGDGPGDARTDAGAVSVVTGGPFSVESDVIPVYVQLPESNEEHLFIHMEREIGLGNVATFDDFEQRRQQELATRGADIDALITPVADRVKSLGGEIVRRCENLPCLYALLPEGAVVRLAQVAGVEFLETHQPVSVFADGLQIRLGTQFIGCSGPGCVPTASPQFLDAGNDGENGSGPDERLAVIETGWFNDKHPGFFDGPRAAPFTQLPDRIQDRFTCGLFGCRRRPISFPRRGAADNDRHATGVAGLMFGDLGDGQDPTVASGGRALRSGYAPESRGYMFKGSTDWGVKNAYDRIMRLEPSPVAVNTSLGLNRNTRCRGRSPWARHENRLFEAGVLSVHPNGELGRPAADDCTVAPGADAIGSFTVAAHQRPPPNSAPNGTLTDVNVAPISNSSTRGGVSFGEGRGRSIMDLTAYGCRRLAFDVNRTTFLLSTALPMFYANYTYSACGTSFAGPIVAAFAVDFTDFYRNEKNSNWIDNPGALFANLLLMGDRTWEQPFRLATRYDSVWGAGRLKARRFDSEGMDGPWGYIRGQVCVTDGEVVSVDFTTPSDVEYVRAVAYWYDRRHDKGIGRVVTSIDAAREFGIITDDIDLRLQNSGHDVIRSTSATDNKERLYMNGFRATGDMRLDIVGFDVRSDGEGCGGNSNRVYWALMWEDGDRDDSDGPSNQIQSDEFYSVAFPQE